MGSHSAAKVQPQGPAPTVATTPNEPQTEILNLQGVKNAKGAGAQISKIRTAPRPRKDRVGCFGSEERICPAWRSWRLAGSPVFSEGCELVSRNQRT
jgi:hypothetical protein